MSSKRNFKNLTPMILETYEELFLDENKNLKEDDELFFFNLLRVKSEVIISESLSLDQFIKYLDEIIYAGDGILINEINKFIESHYALELDAMTQQTKERKRKVNEELQLSDAHAKDLLKIAYLYRVTIPLVSMYFVYNKGNFNNVVTLPQNKKSEEETEEEIVEEPLTESELREMAFEEVNATIFAHLFNIFATDPEALRNKLYKLAYSGVSKTSYSDKKFWSIARNMGITEKTETLEIYKKLLVNAIPKLSIDGNKNVVSFLQSVINNQVDFLFQNKFRYHFVPIGNNPGRSSLSTDNDDESLSEFERMEILQSRKNEGDYILRKMNINDVVSRIPEKLGVGVSDAEVKYVMNKVLRNSIQEQIIATLTFKYFHDKNALKFVNFYQYCYLLVACRKYLQQQKYIYLPLILTARCEKHRERSNIAGKKVRPAIIQSKLYQDMLVEKYPNFPDEIEKPFFSFIGTIYASVFKNEKDEEIFDSSIKVGKIAEEVLNLIKLI